jgi:hypothetical protein
MHTRETAALVVKRVEKFITAQTGHKIKAPAGHTPGSDLALCLDRFHRSGNPESIETPHPRAIRGVLDRA